MLEQFFAFQYWQIDENRRDNDLLRNLIVRNKNKLDKQNLDKIAAKRKKQQEKSFAFYDTEVLFLEQKFKHSLRQKLPTRWADLQELSDNLDVTYILKKIKYACNIVNREQLYNSKHKVGLLQEVLQHIEVEKWHEKNDAIQLYYACFQMLQSNEASKAEQFLILLQEKGDILSKTELASLYDFTLVFYNRQNVKQYDKMLDIYFFRLENNLLQDGKFLHYIHLYNLLILALKLQQFDLVETLAISYKKQIEPEFVKVFYHFSMGKSAFYQKKYQEASKHFECIESSKILYELDRRTHLLKTYFLNNEISLFDSRKNSFRQFLRTNKAISKQIKKQYESFIKFLDSLYKKKDLRNKADKSKLLRLQQKIATETMREGKWLLQEIEKCLNKKFKT